MRMDTSFFFLLRKYGRGVCLFPFGETEGMSGLAFVQPIRETKEELRQVLPTELGLVQAGQFLYLGDPELSLEQMDGGTILCDGVRYELRWAQLIMIGNRPSHWRAILTRKDGVAP